MLSIERARKDAKALHRAGTEPTLARAQLAVARREGYTSWPALVTAGGVTQNDLCDAASRGDIERVRSLLTRLTPMNPLLVPICCNPLRGDETDVVVCVALLLDAGCDPNAGFLLKGEKHTCLWGAREHGHVLLAQLLEARGGVAMP